MSTANTIVRVDGTAWNVEKATTATLASLKTSEEIVDSLGFNFPIVSRGIRTNSGDSITSHKAIYRQDNGALLDVVKAENPIIIQNADTFKVFEPMMAENLVKPVFANTYGDKMFFGVFEITKPFEIMGDEMKYYFIVVNDHTRPDGMLRIISTPIRIACMNAFNSALSSSVLRTYVNGTLEETNMEIASKSILSSFQSTITNLNRKANKMLETKLSDSDIDKIEEQLFPYIEESESEKHTRANYNITQKREAFRECLAANNIVDYKGTAYQVYNALTDYTQHYFTNAKNSFDVNHRMTLISGFNPEAYNEAAKVNKFLSILKTDYKLNLAA